MRSLVFAALACGLLAVPCTATAQIRGAASKSLGQDYHFYTGSSYGRHALEHASILHYYSQAGEAVPADVTKHHATEIRQSVEGSQKSYGNLKKATADNKTAQSHLAEIEKSHKTALAAIDKLDEHGSKDADPKAISAASAEVHQALKAADDAATALQKELKVNALPAPKK